MLTQLQNHLDQNFPFLKDKKLLLAVSGGVDSMVLLDLFRLLPYDFAVAHCNFKLRDKASDLDEELVLDYCSKYEIECFSKHFNTEEYAVLNKQSIQIAARELRYRWFADLLKDNGCHYLLTAHHLDDSVETFLINFTRGTGIDGLLGIPETNDNIIRPLLLFSRVQIQEYAIQEQIPWREDASNATTKYLRNKIRHDVIPILKSKNDDFLNSFKQTIFNLNEAKNLMEDACDLVKKQVSIPSKYILEIAIDKLRQHQNYRAYLYQWLKNYEFKAWDDIYNLIDSETGKKVYSERFVILKNRNSIILDRIQPELDSFFLIFEQDNSIVTPISLIFERLKFENYENIAKNEIFLDHDKLIYPLKLRNKKEGDYFFPIGMNGKKKVSKFFKDEKFSMLDKQNTWILENGNQEIIWIIGHRMDERYKITQQTINKFKIKLIQ